MAINLWPGACLVNGKWVSASENFGVYNPADGSLICKVPNLGSGAVQDAIDSAEFALPAWARRSASDRSILLMAWHALILEHEHELAQILTTEQGKPLAEALGEIRYAAAFLSWFAEEGKRGYGDVIPSPDPNKRILVLKQPVGVVAAITPWNFPAAMVTRKLGPALAAGCTVVLKPAEQTPLTALALGALAEVAGFPAGVLNIITGDAREIGKLLTSSAIVRKLSFTGSTEVGALLYAQSAPTIKKLSLELGGNAPFIVFDDADVSRAIDSAIRSKFRNAGQTCICPNRFYVQAGVYDQFVEGFTSAVEALAVGPGLDPRSQIGPLIDDAAVKKVEAHVKDAVDGGASITTGGKRHARGGHFFLPTVLSGVNGDMLVTQEETFGPLAPISRFETDRDAVDLANATPFGLAAYIFTREITRAWRVSEALEVGMVGVNTAQISSEVAPFGGVKSSGLGREGSRYGLEDYLEAKMVCLEL